MPNLKPPVTTTALARAYRERILAALPPGARFEPLMTLYLTDRTDAGGDRSRAGAAASSSAPSSIPPARRRIRMPASPPSRRIYAVLEAMSEVRHACCRCTAKSPTSDVDVFDREARFIDRVLARGRERFPKLRIVFEHVTTRDGRAVRAAARATASARRITPQHLLLNRNAICSRAASARTTTACRC